MSAKGRICDIIFYMVIGVLYAFALTRAVFDATILELPDKGLLLLCAGFLAALYLLLFNWRTALASLIILILAGAGVYFALWRGGFEAEWLHELVSVLRELLDFSRGQSPYREELDRPLSYIVCGAASLVTALCMRPRFSFAIMAAAGAAVMIFPVSVGWSENAATMPLYLFCVLALLVKRLNLGAVMRERGHMRQNAVFALAAVPLCVMASVMAWAIPKPSNLPGERETASGEPPRSLVEAADNLLGGAGLGSGGRTTSYTGDGSRLGGPNTLGDQLVMEVFCDERVYLAGSVREDYTGSAWRSADSGRTGVVPDSSGIYRASQYSQEELAQQDYYRRFYAQNEATVTVNIMDNRTVTVFSPPFMRELYTASASDSPPLQRDNLGALTFGRAPPRDFSYTQSFTAWDYSNRYILELLRTADSNADGRDMSAFLALPESLPERVRELAADITTGEATDYDKLIAIARYLSSFPYTLSPDSVPRGEDFVDYFLFTGREGYCVYYATALAVLARCEGIPARYVEGFVMPRERNPNGGFTVTGKQAHAWAEAYFPGFGWVIIEATPPDFAGDSDLAAAPEPSEQAEPLPAPPEIETEQPQPDSDTTPPPPPSENESGGGESTGFGAAAAIAAIVICALGALAFLARLRYKRRAAMLASLSNRDAARTCFARLLGAAAALGCPPLQNETAHAWAVRAGGDLPLPKDVAASALADIFARAAYSGHDVTIGERSLMESACDELFARLRQRRRGPLAALSHLWSRYVMLKY